MLNWDLAEEYAKRYHIPDQAHTEANWQFRARVARSLAEMKKELLAHEVLYNQRMSENSFAHGELGGGYGDTLIAQIAQRTEAAFQYEKQRQEHRRSLQGFFALLWSWLEPEAK